MSNDLNIDPDAVDIGDGLKCAEGQSAVAVIGVDADAQQVKVYSPSGEQTVRRWVSMDMFSVHRPNEDIQTDADREQWLNDTLPATLTEVNGEVRPLQYTLDENGNVQREVPA